MAEDSPHSSKTKNKKTCHRRVIASAILSTPREVGSQDGTLPGSQGIREMTNNVHTTKSSFKTTNKIGKKATETTDQSCIKKPAPLERKEQSLTRKRPASQAAASSPTIPITALGSTYSGARTKRKKRQSTEAIEDVAAACDDNDMKNYSNSAEPSSLDLWLPSIASSPAKFVDVNQQQKQNDDDNMTSDKSQTLVPQENNAPSNAAAKEKVIDRNDALDRILKKKDQSDHFGDNAAQQVTRRSSSPRAFACSSSTTASADSSADVTRLRIVTPRCVQVSSVKPTPLPHPLAPIDVTKAVQTTAPEPATFKQMAKREAKGNATINKFIDQPSQVERPLAVTVGKVKHDTEEAQEPTVEESKEIFEHVGANFVVQQNDINSSQNGNKGSTSHGISRSYEKSKMKNPTGDSVNDDAVARKRRFHTLDSRRHLFKASSDNAHHDHDYDAGSDYDDSDEMRKRKKKYSEPSMRSKSSKKSKPNGCAVGNSASTSGMCIGSDMFPSPSSASVSLPKSSGLTSSSNDGGLLMTSSREDDCDNDCDNDEEAEEITVDRSIHVSKMKSAPSVSSAVSSGRLSAPHVSHAGSIVPSAKNGSPTRKSKNGSPTGIPVSSSDLFAAPSPPEIDWTAKDLIESEEGKAKVSNLIVNLEKLMGGSTLAEKGAKHALVQARLALFHLLRSLGVPANLINLGQLPNEHSVGIVLLNYEPNTDKGFLELIATHDPTKYHNRIPDTNCCIRLAKATLPASCVKGYCDFDDKQKMEVESALISSLCAMDFNLIVSGKEVTKLDREKDPEYAEKKANYCHATVLPRLKECFGKGNYEKVIRLLLTLTGRAIQETHNTSKPVPFMSFGANACAFHAECAKELSSVLLCSRLVTDSGSREIIQQPHPQATMMSIRCIYANAEMTTRLDANLMFFTKAVLASVNESKTSHHTCLGKLECQEETYFHRLRMKIVAREVAIMVYQSGGKRFRDLSPSEQDVILDAFLSEVRNGGKYDSILLPEAFGAYQSGDADEFHIELVERYGYKIATAWVALREGIDEPWIHTTLKDNLFFKTMKAFEAYNAGKADPATMAVLENNPAFKRKKAWEAYNAGERDAETLALLENDPAFKRKKAWEAYNAGEQDAETLALLEDNHVFQTTKAWEAYKAGEQDAETLALLENTHAFKTKTAFDDYKAGTADAETLALLENNPCFQRMKQAQERAQKPIDFLDLENHTKPRLQDVLREYKSKGVRGVIMHRGKSKQELIQQIERCRIVVPPDTKLRILIATRSGTATATPYIKKVYEDSVLAGKIKEGDLLLEVNGEDVRSKTATEVGELLSKLAACQKVLLVTS